MGTTSPSIGRPLVSNPDIGPGIAASALFKKLYSVGMLRLKEPSAAKSLATAKLKIYPGGGRSELTRAFQALLAERKEMPAPLHVAGLRTAFSSCAMEMGTVKEPDVFLTYAHHMDDARM